MFTYDRLPEALGGNPWDQYHPHPGLYPGGLRPTRHGQKPQLSVLIDLGITPLAPYKMMIVDPAA